MKKMVLVLSMLATVIGLAFSKECATCKNTYYGESCPYCIGYAEGSSSYYTGQNSNTCDNIGSNINHNGKELNSPAARRQKTEERSQCWQGFNDARNDINGSGN